MKKRSSQGTLKSRTNYQLTVFQGQQVVLIDTIDLSSQQQTKSSRSRTRRQSIILAYINDQFKLTRPSPVFSMFLINSCVENVSSVSSEKSNMSKSMLYFMSFCSLSTLYLYSELLKVCRIDSYDNGGYSILEDFFGLQKSKKEFLNASLGGAIRFNTIIFNIVYEPIIGYSL